MNKTTLHHPACQTRINEALECSHGCDGATAPARDRLRENVVRFLWERPDLVQNALLFVACVLIGTLVGALVGAWFGDVVQ